MIEPTPADEEDTMDRPQPPHPPTPDTATWDPRIDVDVELLGDNEPVDEVDVADESWAPGQGRPGLPAEEVLHVYRDTELIAAGEELDLDDVTEDELAIAAADLEADDDR